METAKAETPIIYKRTGERTITSMTPDKLFWLAVVQNLLGVVAAIRRYKIGGKTQEKCVHCGK